MAEPSLAASRAALLALAAFVAVAVLERGTPAPAGPSAPNSEFSADRALELLRSIASVPHPLDSAENDAARERILQRLSELGVSSESQEWHEQVRAGQDRRSVLATGVNVVAGLPGRRSAGPVALFVCHYDARPGPSRASSGSVAAQGGSTLRDFDRSDGGAPGAGDDGAAAAAFLETLRALRAGPPLENELWFLFTDGEEYGLLGAKAFAEQPRVLDRVAVVLNFEGRGNGGPVVLFETGRDEAPWIRAYARAVRWAQASSLGPTVYERLPNDTDFSVFKDRGLPGLNFAFIGGGSAYHRPWDTPQNLDRASLQHHGEIALGLARYLGAADLATLAGERGHAAYFTLPGNVLVRYPRAWELAGALFALLAAAGALASAVRSGTLRTRGIALAALGFPVLTALTAAALFGIAWAVQQVVPRFAGALGWIGDVEQRGNRASTTWTALGVALLAGTIAAAIAGRSRRAWTETLGAGALVAWSAVAFVAAVVAPGAAHVVTWPALFGAVGLHLAIRTRAQPTSGSRAAVTQLLAVVPPLLVLLPVLDLLAQVGSVAAIGPALLSALVAAPTIGLVAPCLRECSARSPRFALAAGGLAAIAALAWGAALAARGF
jgi:Peptidase family M28